MLLSASSVIGDNVTNGTGEDLGTIEDLMVCTDSGSVKYAVVSFGGFLGMGDKLFAVPMDTLTLNAENKCFVMNVDKERLENAPGFDKNNWPDTASTEWQNSISSYYNAP